MAATARQWQARIEIGQAEWEEGEYYRTTYVYGETIDKLRRAAATCLRETNPHYFSNGGDHIIGRTIYYHYNRIHGSWSEPEELPEGWLYQEASLDHNHMKRLPTRTEEQLRNFEAAVVHFATTTLIPEKGPDYRSKAIVGDKFVLPLLEKVLREGEEDKINDLIQRGWHIIGLEYKGEPSMTGELMNRQAIFVMGHPEMQVANTTLKTSSYMDES